MSPDFEKVEGAVCYWLVQPSCIPYISLTTRAIVWENWLAYNEWTGPEHNIINSMSCLENSLLLIS